jgi:hypothetical protein
MASIGAYAGSSYRPTGPTPAQAQAELYRKQTEEATAKKQEELNQAERDRMAMEATRRALDAQVQMMGNSANPQTSDGRTLEVSNYGTTGDYGGSSSGGSRSSAPAAAPAPAAPAMDLSAIEALMNRYAPSPVSAPSAPATIAAPTAPSSKANAFANAKNISGRQGAAAIKALHDTMSRRGFADSGMEVEGEAGILGDVANFNSESAFKADLADDERTWDAAKLGFEGALGQRSDDMGLATTGYQGQIAQRGQDLDKLNTLLAYATRRY